MVSIIFPKGLLASHRYDRLEGLHKHTEHKHARTASKKYVGRAQRMYPDPQNLTANPNEFVLLEMCGCRTPSDASSFSHNRIVFFVKIRAENYI
jgi:hypothetical protein